MSKNASKSTTKVSSGSTSRFAQACDRCRIKRIRCDGLVNQCSPCAAAGLDCKTTAKLARRPVSGGYTRYLEETVRSLEEEVRTLNAVLAEKDKRIAFFEACSPRPYHNGPTPIWPSHGTIARPQFESQPEFQPWEHDLVESLPSLSPADGESPQSILTSPENASTSPESLSIIPHHETAALPADGYFWNPVDSDVAFSDQDTSPISQLHDGSLYKPPPSEPAADMKIPPQLVSDRLVDIFFHDWAPKFPILHQPSFYALYESYIQDPTSIVDLKSIAQLNLVFCIAALSSSFRDPRDTVYYDMQWRLALDASMPCDTLAGVQCLILAQIYSIEKGDVSSQLRYMALAVQASQKLGLHEAQADFDQGALASETRKRVFWTLYTLDCFAAAQLNLPRLMKEEDVRCEYPTDVDDVCVTEHGIQPRLAGGDTKISAVLSMFRGSRILAQSLETAHVAPAPGEAMARCG